MRGRVEISAEADGAGGTRLVRLRSGPPLSARQTLDGVTLVASAGGPLGGDVLDVDVRVGPAAELSVGSAAATVVQPSRSGGEAVLRLEIAVSAGGALFWRPRPTVVANGAAYRCLTSVRLEPGAVLVLSEITVLGRHGERGGSAAARLDVEHDGRPLLRTESAWGAGGWPGWHGAAVLGGRRVVGTALVVGLPAPGVPDGPDAEVLALGERACLVSVLGDGTLGVERALDGLPAGAVRGRSGVTAALH